MRAPPSGDDGVAEHVVVNILDVDMNSRSGPLSPGADVARDGPNPGADAAAASPVPAQNWQQGGSPGADVAAASPVPVKMWQ